MITALNLGICVLQRRLVFGSRDQLIGELEDATGESTKANTLDDAARRIPRSQGTSFGLAPRRILMDADERSGPVPRNR